MRKTLFVFVVMIGIIATVLTDLYIVRVEGEARSLCREELIRIHIRANSNTTADQAVKLLVRDAIIERMAGVAETVTTKQEVEELMALGLLEELQAIACEVLTTEGMTYSAKVTYRQEDFPPKTYGDIFLAADIYDALVIELGEGVGDNWWCIAFPPLCFHSTGEADQKPRSRIAEWLARLFG